MPPSSTDTWDWDSQPDTCMYEKPRATFRHDTFLAPMFTCKANKPESYLAPNKSTGPATRRSMAPAIHHQRSKEQAREKKKRENHKKVKVGRIIGFLKRRGTTAHNNTERTRGGRRSRLQARKRPLELLTLLPADTTSRTLLKAVRYAKHPKLHADRLYEIYGKNTYKSTPHKPASICTKKDPPSPPQLATGWTRAERTSTPPTNNDSTFLFSEGAPAALISGDPGLHLGLGS